MDFVKGFISNAFAISIVHPIDVIKSRFQVTKTNNLSVNKIIFDVLKTNGYKGFYRGLLPNIGTYPVFWAIFFQTKKNNVDLTDNDLINKFITSYIAGNIASTFTNPLFVLKIRFQVNSNNKLEIIKNLNKNKLSYLKGLHTTYINNLKLGLQFPLYDYLKNKTDNVVFSSFTSKFICSSLFYPLDLIRVNQRNSNKKLTIRKISKNIYKKSGIKGFYKGLLLYNCVSLINFTLMITLLEKLKV